MEKKYTKEQFWELYKKLPDDLKDAIFSDDNTNAIENICKRNEIEEEKISEIASLIGHVFLGLLPFEEFGESLKKDLGIKGDKAKKLTTEIYRFIFFPMKGSLEKLYEPPSQKSEEQGNKPVASGENIKEQPEEPIEKPIQNKEKTPPRADNYREEI